MYMHLVQIPSNPEVFAGFFSIIAAHPLQSMLYLLSLCQHTVLSTKIYTTKYQSPFTHFSSSSSLQVVTCKMHYLWGLKNNSKSTKCVIQQFLVNLWIKIANENVGTHIKVFIVRWCLKFQNKVGSYSRNKTWTWHLQEQLITSNFHPFIAYSR